MRSAIAFTALALSASAALAQQPSTGQPRPPRAGMGQPMGQPMGPGMGQMGRRGMRQPPMGGPGMGMGMMGARQRMRFNRPPARAVLALRSQLALTDGQVTRLEALASAQQAALRPDRAAQLRARADFIDAQQKDDLDAERSALDKIARLRTDAILARLKARKDVKDVLTPDQRGKLETQFARRMVQRRGGMGIGMPGGGPMPRRGVGGVAPGGPPSP